MAGAVHLVGGSRMAEQSPGSSKLVKGLETGIYACLVAIALCAPLSIKATVNCFRAASVLWVILLCTRKRKLWTQPLTLPLALLLVLTAISSAFSVDPFLSWGRMRTVTLAFMAVIIGQTVSTLHRVRILAFVVIGATLLTVAYTGWQYTAGIGVEAVGSQAAIAPLRRFGILPGDIIRSVNGKSTRRGDQLLAELERSQTAVKIVLWRETPNAFQPMNSKVAPRKLKDALQQPGIQLVRGHPPRAQGFYKHYFPFSGVLVLVGLLVGGITMEVALKARIALAGAFIAIATAVGLTLTRSSLFALFIGTLVIVFTRPKRRTAWITVAAVIALSCAGVYWIQRHRAAATAQAQDPGTEYRFLMWRDSVKLVKAHPLLGVGLDSVAGDWQRWDLEAYRRFPLHSHFHSSPIQIAVECGLPALAVWIWLLAAYAIFLFRLQRGLRTNALVRGLIVGIFAGLIAFVLSGFLQYNFGDAEVMVIFWFSMGLAFAVSRIKEEARTSPIAPFDSGAAEFLR